MPSFNTDTALEFEFSITFFASSGPEAEKIADSIASQFFGTALAGLIDVGFVSNALVGQDVSGANYTYTFTLSVKMGGADASPPFFNTIAADNALEALAQLRANATRIAQVSNMPMKLNHLQESV